MIFIKKLKYFLNVFYKDEIINNTVYSLIIKVFAVFLGYFFNFYISKKYGAESVGVLNISVSTISLISVVSVFGFDQAILRFFAQFGHTKRDLKKIYLKMVLFVLSISLFFSLSIIFISKYLSFFLLKSENNRVIFILVALAIPFLSINNLNVEAIRGLKLIKDNELFRMLYSNLINIIIFFLLLSFIEYNNQIPVFSTVIGMIFTSVFSSLFLIKKFQKKNFLNENLSITTKELIIISMPMFVITASNIFTNYLPTYILAYFKSAKDVGIFNIAFKIATVTSFFLVSINSIVAPKFAEFYWNNKSEDLKKTVYKSAKLNFWSSVPLLLSFILFPKFFMGLFGKEFVEGYRSLVILSIGQFVNAFCGSVGYLLTMTGNQVVFRNIYFTSTIINLSLCIILVPHIGVDGASLSFSISMIFWNVVSLIYVRKKFGIVTYYVPFVKYE